MPFFNAPVEKVFQDQFTRSHIFLSPPKSTISTGGGAKLKRYSPPADNPTVETLGFVLTSPNVSRAFHPGFDPTDEPDRYENDFLDKLVYVSADEYQASDVNTKIIDIDRKSTRLNSSN